MNRATNPALVAVSPGAFLANNVLVGAALEEVGAAAVRAVVVVAVGRVLEESDVRGLVGLVTGARAGRDAREAVDDARVERRSDDVEAVLAWAGVRDVAPVAPVVLPGKVDMRLDSPFMDFLFSSPDVRLAFPSWSEAVVFDVVTGRFAVEVAADGLAGGLVKPLPIVL